VLDSIAGLPAHPLLVHGAVVLAPLAAVGAVVMALWSRFSRRFGVVVVVVSGVAFVSSALAKLSGERMAERVGTPQPHAELADPMPILVLLLALLVTGLWLLDRGRPTNRSRPVLVVLLAVAVVAVSILVTYWMVRVGHTGAEAVWSSVS
jgi:divalent metal cation (Fe/Co/Zn/Cd) transporter